MAEKTTFIKLDRNIVNWRWYKEPNTMRVFLHLLLTANIRDYDFRYDTIHRGEVAVSIGNLGKSTGLSYDQVRTALTHLKDTNEITITRRPKYLVISIVKYNEYQDNPNQNPNESQTNPNQIPIKSQQSKNNKKNKKDKNYIYTDYGGVCLSDSDWDELKGIVKDDGEFLKVIDRVGEWLQDNPRPIEKHKSIVRTFLRNDGYEM